VGEPGVLYTINSLVVLVEISPIVLPVTYRISTTIGYDIEKGLFFKMKKLKMKIVAKSIIQLIVVIPIFSIFDPGSEEAFAVSSSVNPVRKLRTEAEYIERKWMG
jgi:hypothetical protein